MIAAIATIVTMHPPIINQGRRELLPGELSLNDEVVSALAMVGGVVGVDVGAQYTSVGSGSSTPEERSRTLPQLRQYLYSSDTGVLQREQSFIYALEMRAANRAHILA